ncbi:MAG: hypothetical protein JNM84_08035 [Planctomycetes bacterium]|nr:hypothetical protein [Planctomycetota bacterium]
MIRLLELPVRLPRLAPSCTGIATMLLAMATMISPAEAQRTWTITGEQFFATVQAAAPGDVLLVSGEVYAFPPQTIRKPLSIHGLPGAKFNAAIGLTIDGIPAGQTFVIQGFEMSGWLNVKACAGPVLLADLFQSNPILASVRMSIESSFDVSLTRCAMVNCAIAVSGSSVTFSDCAITAPSIGNRATTPPTPAIATLGSFVRFSRTRLTGGSSQYSTPGPYPAILAASSSLRVSGRECVLTAGSSPFAAMSAIEGDSTLTLDPAATLTPSGGAPAISAAMQVLSRAHPTTSVALSPIGGVTSVRLHGLAGRPGMLFVGLPGLPESIPGFFGELRIAQPIAVASGVLDANGELSISFAVSADPILRSLTLRWQGLAGDGTRPIWAEPSTVSHN